MKTITGKCPEVNCGQTIGPCSSQAAFNRALGFHRLKTHGIQGKNSTDEGRRMQSRRYYWRKIGVPENQMAAKEAEYLARQQAMGPMAPKRKSKGDAKHMELDKCPKCQTSFLQRPHGGNTTRALSLEYCPVCGIRFYYTEG